MHYKSENTKLIAQRRLYPLEQTVLVGDLSQYINETGIIQNEESEKSFVSDVRKIDFKEKTIPERYFYKNANEDISLYMKADYYKMPMCFHQTENNLIFKAARPMASEWYFLYSLKDNKGMHWIDNHE